MLKAGMALTRKEVPTFFYHGGVAGLAVDDFILPPKLVPHDANDLWYRSLGIGDSAS